MREDKGGGWAPKGGKKWKKKTVDGIMAREGKKRRKRQPRSDGGKDRGRGTGDPRGFFTISDRGKRVRLRRKLHTGSGGG